MASQPSNEAPGPLRGRRILIVEDEILIGIDLESIFAGAGADVVGPCSTLRDAMRAASTEDLSAAMLDIRLGRQTTAEVARLLDERQIPYFFYTGQPAAAVALLRGEGSAPMVMKPAHKRQLIEAMLRLLAPKTLTQSPD